MPRLWGQVLGDFLPGAHVARPLHLPGAVWQGGTWGKLSDQGPVSLLLSEKSFFDRQAHCTVWPGSLCSAVQFTLYTAQCTMHNAQCTMQCGLH